MSDNDPQDEVVITLDIDGQVKEYRFQEDTTSEEIIEFVDSKTSFETDPPAKPNEDGIRTLCRVKDCEETEVFDNIEEIKDSEWTDIGTSEGLLGDLSDLHHAVCPNHSLNE